MSRRPHKKSKNGCLECKKRHIRCDENHPVCTNCRAAETRCSFLGKNLPYIVPGLLRGHPYVASSSTISSAASTPASSAATPRAAPNGSDHGLLDPYSVNTTHIKLFNNIFSNDFRSSSSLGFDDLKPAAVYIKHALTTPYLMHQILAMSALQLSAKHPESRDLHRDYATGLQHRALALFNESNPVLEVTPANCVNMFLFSSSVGVHLLSDTLLYGRDSLDSFIDKFTHCLRVYRGVIAVVDQCGDLLRETELEPLLLRPGNASGPECDLLQDLINAADVSPASLEAYRESISHLQQIFDGQRAGLNYRSRVTLVVGWPLRISLEYVELLRQRQAEALIILAHYAVILHRGRDLWLIGEAGRFLIDSIWEFLGPKWQAHLKFPVEALREDKIT